MSRSVEKERRFEYGETKIEGGKWRRREER